MLGIGGLTIAIILPSNTVQLNLNNDRKALQASTTRLSGGLRVNTAADDPSGLAISPTQRHPLGRLALDLHPQSPHD